MAEKTMLALIVITETLLCLMYVVSSGLSHQVLPLVDCLLRENKRPQRCTQMEAQKEFSKSGNYTVWEQHPVHQKKIGVHRPH